MGATIRLEFDRSDRTYRTGEPVRGLVRVSTKGGTTCRGLRLNHSWETDGKGNLDRGYPPTAIPLPEGVLPTSSARIPRPDEAPLLPWTSPGGTSLRGGGGRNPGGTRRQGNRRLHRHPWSPSWPPSRPSKEPPHFAERNPPHPWSDPNPLPNRPVGFRPSASTPGS